MLGAAETIGDRVSPLPASPTKSISWSGLRVLSPLSLAFSVLREPLSYVCVFLPSSLRRRSFFPLSLPRFGRAKRSDDSLQPPSPTSLVPLSLVSDTGRDTRRRRIVRKDFNLAAAFKAVRFRLHQEGCGSFAQLVYVYLINLDNKTFENSIDKKKNRNTQPKVSRNQLVVPRVVNSWFENVSTFYRHSML